MEISNRYWPPVMPYWHTVSCLCPDCEYGDRLIDLMAFFREERYSAKLAGQLFEHPPEVD